MDELGKDNQKINRQQLILVALAIGAIVLIWLLSSWLY